MDISTYLLPIFGPSSQVLCYNHLSEQHFLVSLISHFLVLLIRKLLEKKRQNIVDENGNLTKNEEDYDSINLGKTHFIFLFFFDRE